jgi:hypothetical protein
LRELEKDDETNGSVAGKVTAIPRLYIYWRISGRTQLRETNRIDQPSTKVIDCWFHKEECFYEFLKERETVSQNKRHQVRRS